MKQLLMIVMLCLGSSESAFAQSAESSPAAKVTLARRLYDEGSDAVDKGRWSVAHDRFKASYELAPRVVTLYNLAGAQGQTGRLVEAAESYRRFLRETADGRYPELRTVATNQLELLDKQIAQVTIDITNIEHSDLISIDEIEFPQVALHEPIPMNPGPHVVRVQRGEKLLTTRALALTAGTPESVRIELPANQLDLQVHRSIDPPAMTAAVPGPAPADHGSNHAWLRSPWLWSGVAAVVIASAAGAYLFTRPDGVAIH